MGGPPLESGIDVGPWINVGHEQKVHIYVTKKPSNLKISVEPGKFLKINKRRAYVYAGL